MASETLFRTGVPPHWFQSPAEATVLTAQASMKATNLDMMHLIESLLSHCVHRNVIDGDFGVF